MENHSKAHYDFDAIIDRTQWGDLKYCGVKDYWGRDDLLPLWVADMDFATPPFIIEALRHRMEHPIFGYTRNPDEYWPAVIRWVHDHHQWNICEEWLRYIPGIVKGIGMVIDVFTRPGDSVVIMPPVYHPFRLVPEGNGRRVVCCPLKESPGTFDESKSSDSSSTCYSIDFDRLAEVCTETHPKVLILSNPHNPVGICWRREVLQQLAEFCFERQILVISDEIHCDMAIFGHRHVPFATVNDQAAQISITFQAPTKTFNIAGIVSSYSVIPNEELRRAFYGWLKANEFDAPNLFAPIATVAAFSPEGERWRRQMLSYIEQNCLFLEDYCRRNIPQIHPVRPEASFLVWLDCRQLGLTHSQLLELFIDKAHLALNDGAIFDAKDELNPLRQNSGEGFMRLNVGAPRAVLARALEQLREAVGQL